MAFKMKQKTGDNIRLYHTDHLGSTALVTDIDGEVTQNIAYIPYGEIFVEQRNGTWSSPYLFNAKELDEETGLYYYGARYLDPTGTRWLSVDPLFEKYVGMTPYGYCAGNPVKLVDVDGKSPESQRDRMLPTGSEYMNAGSGGCNAATAKLLASHYDCYYNPNVENDRLNPTHGAKFHKYMKENTYGLKTTVVIGPQICNRRGKYKGNMTYEDEIEMMKENIKCGNVSYVATTQGHTKAINDVEVYVDKKGRKRCKIQYMDNYYGTYDTEDYKMSNMTKYRFGNIFKVEKLPLQPDNSCVVKDKEVQLQIQNEKMFYNESDK